MRDALEVLSDVMASAETVRIVIETVGCETLENNSLVRFFAERGLGPGDGVVRIDVLKGESQEGKAYWGPDLYDAVVAVSQDYPPSLLEG